MEIGRSVVVTRRIHKPAGPVHGCPTIHGASDDPRERTSSAPKLFINSIQAALQIAAPALPAGWVATAGTRLASAGAAAVLRRPRSIHRPVDVVAAGRFVGGRARVRRRCRCCIAYCNVSNRHGSPPPPPGVRNAATQRIGRMSQGWHDWPGRGAESGTDYRVRGELTQRGEVVDRRACMVAVVDLVRFARTGAGRPVQI